MGNPIKNDITKKSCNLPGLLIAIASNKDDMQRNTPKRLK
jgi:hypothetical protein